MKQACILIIETATPNCSVALILPDGKVHELNSPNLNDHSSQITLLIDTLLRDAGLSYKSLDAVAVSNGPGSYTGLRIGMSTAKGLCFALDIPLITISTLRSAAEGIMSVTSSFWTKPYNIIIPLVDARRMEVYSAVFNSNFSLLRPIQAEIIDINSWAAYADVDIWVGGSGANKLEELFANRKEIHVINNQMHQARFGAFEASEKFSKQLWADLAYSEPEYIKDFIPGTPVVKGLR